MAVLIRGHFGAAHPFCFKSDSCYQTTREGGAPNRCPSLLSLPSPHRVGGLAEGVLLSPTRDWIVRN